MTYQQRADYIEASNSLRIIANKYLQSGDYRTSAIHKARREILHAADLIDNALDMEASASLVHGRGTEA